MLDASKTDILMLPEQGQSSFSGGHIIKMHSNLFYDIFLYLERQICHPIKRYTQKEGEYIFNFSTTFERGKLIKIHQFQRHSIILLIILFKTPKKEFGGKNTFFNTLYCQKKLIS